MDDDNVLGKARQRHDILTANAARLQVELDRILSEIKDLDGFFRVAEKLADVVPTREVFRQASKRALITDFAKDAILRSGALSSSMILDEIEKTGHGGWVGGKDRRARVSNIAALMSRDARFVSDRQAGGYLLKDTAPSGENHHGRTPYTLMQAGKM